MKKELATLGGGCFWCLEAVFTRFKGIIKVVSGYAGGRIPNPNYERVCTGSSGYAEVVQISFDADVMSYEQLLGIFFTIHDPTTLNRQGHDIGTQYRSVIFYHDESQRDLAQKVVKEVSKHYPNPIVTEISPLPTFYMAESYHQNYFALNPQQSYCKLVVFPKVEHAKALYSAFLK